MFIKSKLYLFILFQIIFVTRRFANAAESLYEYEQMLIEELMIDSLRYFQHNIDPNNLSKYDIEMINLLARIINRRKVLIPQNVKTRPLFWFTRTWRSID
jgi:deoxyadenosine/deoxycytidine kinase